MFSRAVMSKRLSATLLALAALLASAPLRASAAREMTDEEAREARALAVRFVERLRETDDFAPLVAEFFPADFDERLRQFLLETPEGTDDSPPLPLDPALLRRVDAAELRRTYVALMNFWNQQHLLHRAAWDYVVLEHKAAGRDARSGQGAWGQHYELAERAIPAEAFRVAAGDPLLEPLFQMVRGPGDDDDEAPRDEESEKEKDKAMFEAAYVRDAARLRAFNSKLERCVVLLREAVAKLRSDAKGFAAARNVPDAAADPDDFKVYHLDDEATETPAFGLPAGAPLIRARVYPFEMAMTRAGGRLKMLAAYPDTDGD